MPEVDRMLPLPEATAPPSADAGGHVGLRVLMMIEDRTEQLQQQLLVFEVGMLVLALGAVLLLYASYRRLGRIERGLRRARKRRREADGAEAAS